MRKSVLMIMMVLCLVAVPLAGAQQQMTEGAPLDLMTDTPEEGFQLAISLARKAVVATQPDKEVLTKLRPAYSHDPDSLISASHVVAVHFQTIAAANNYWRDTQ